MDWNVSFGHDSVTGQPRYTEVNLNLAGPLSLDSVLDAAFAYADEFGIDPWEVSIR